MDINFSQKIQYLSRISSRGVLGKVLADRQAKYENLRVVFADSMTSARCSELYELASHKVINVGIAEQNMIGISAGLASEGMNVFATTFAPFASMRCFEQLRTQLGYMNLNVKVVALLSGLSTGVSGNTHYGLEDLALVRTIPNFVVLSPADCFETYKAIKAALEYEGPMYIRLTGVNGAPSVYKEDYSYEIGKGIVLREGKEVAIVATGPSVYESLRAARVLAKDGILVTVINMHTIKPLDIDLLNSVFANHRLVLTVEEHFAIGGLGSAVAEYKSSLMSHCKHVIMGIPDCFLKAGDYNYMIRQAGLDAQSIADTVKKNLI